MKRTVLLTLSIVAAVFVQAQIIRLDTVPGKSLVLNGTNGIHLGNPAFIEQMSTGNFTISAWIKTSVTGKRQQIVSLGNYAATDEALWFFVNEDGRLQTDLSNTPGPIGISRISDGSWHHVALVVLSTADFYLYIDGHLETGPFPMSPNLQGRDSSFAIGRAMLSSNSDMFGFEGEIDEVKIIGAPRTGPDVRWDMNRPSHITENLYAYYQFNQLVQDSVYDAYGRTNGIITGGETLKASTAPVGNKGVQRWMNHTSGPLFWYNGYSNDTTMQYMLTDTFDNPVEVYTTEMAFAPNVVPHNTAAYPKMWLMRSYGDPGTFSGDMKLKLSTAQMDRQNIRLYRREPNADGNWTLIATAEPSQVKSGSVTFRNVNMLGQFMVASRTVQNALDEQQATLVKVYPNPVAHELYVERGYAHGITVVNIYSIAGQLVYSGKPGVSETRLDVSGLEQGCYIIRMQGEAQVYTGRFIKE
jgi:hypothetical protein